MFNISFKQKEALFQKRHSTWSNIFNRTAERSTFSKKWAYFRGKFNMAPKSGTFSRNNSTWPKKCFFQLKSCSTCAFLCFSSSLSLSLYLSTSDPSPSPLLSLTLVTPSLCSSTFLHYLSFSLTFSVLGSDLDWGLGSSPKPKLGFRV